MIENKNSTFKDPSDKHFFLCHYVLYQLFVRWNFFSTKRFLPFPTFLSYRNPGFKLRPILQIYICLVNFVVVVDLMLVVRRYTAMDETGSMIAVAGRTGFACYSAVTRYANYCVVCHFLRSLKRSH